MAEVVYSATGRRKSSVARVRLVPGEGKVVINGREMNDYFGLETSAAVSPARPVLSVTASAVLCARLTKNIVRH